MSKVRADPVLHSFHYKVCLLPSALPVNVPLNFQSVDVVLALPQTIWFGAAL